MSELRSAALREANLKRLSALGFRVSPGLPVSRGEGEGLRAPVEIASRLMALDALFSWVALREKQAEEARLRRYVEKSQLEAWLTDEEREVLSLPRAKARAEHAARIGWKLENMWPLAWALGFEKAPPVDGTMIQPATIEAVLFRFLPGFDATAEGFAEKAKARSALEVVALEDLFYCAHNAVRGAQLGGGTVPEGFDPVAEGGVIHERRHALTWCISPGVAWDDTDLST